MKARALAPMAVRSAGVGSAVSPAAGWAAAGEGANGPEAQAPVPRRVPRPVPRPTPMSEPVRKVRRPMPGDDTIFSYRGFESPSFPILPRILGHPAGKMGEVGLNRLRPYP